MECNTVSLIPRTSQFLSFSWSCTIMHRSRRGGKSGSIHYVNDIRWKLRGRIYNVPGSFLGFPKTVHSLSFPSCAQPPPRWVPQTPRSGNLGYGPVVYVSLSSSIITTQQHGERDSKEAGKQLSSFTNLGGSANVIPCGQVAR